MNSKRWFRFAILFMMTGIIVFIFVRNVWPVLERSEGTVDAALPKKREIVYTYKGPDGTLWTHSNVNALERLREHYSLNSPEVFNRIEAERQPIEKTFKETTTGKMPVPPGNLIWSSNWIEAIVVGVYTLIIGVVSLYALRSSNGSRRESTPFLSPPSQGGDIGGVEYRTQDPGLPLKLKTIVIELLYHLVTFSQENPELRSDRFKELIDDYVAKLKTTLPPDELGIIERELKKLVTQQWKLIKSLIEGRDKELKALIASLVESMNFFARDNANFSLNINRNLNNIEKVLTLDEIKEIRESITGEITHAREVIEEKHQSDSKKIEELSITVKSLDEELSEVKEEAQFDGLTRLYNRKAFDSRIVEKIERGKIRGATFTLALIDIDYFKRINDTFGHAAGDEVLRNLSAFLKDYLEKGDFIARYGGEEFAVILDEGNRVLVQKLLEGMREGISKQKFNVRHGESASGMTGDEMIPVTVSVGIAFCKWHDTVETLIKRADKALYSAKKAGRNMVVTEDGYL